MFLTYQIEYLSLRYHHQWFASDLGPYSATCYADRTTIVSAMLIYLLRAQSPQDCACAALNWESDSVSTGQIYVSLEKCSRVGGR